MNGNYRQTLSTVGVISYYESVAEVCIGKKISILYYTYTLKSSKKCTRYYTIL